MHVVHRLHKLARHKQISYHGSCAQTMQCYRQMSTVLSLSGQETGKRTVLSLHKNSRNSEVLAVMCRELATTVWRLRDILQKLGVNIYGLVHEPSWEQVCCIVHSLETGWSRTTSWYSHRVIKLWCFCVYAVV